MGGQPGHKRDFYMNVSGPNCYVVLHDGCLYVYKDERSSSPMKACSLYGFHEYELRFFLIVHELQVVEDACACVWMVNQIKSNHKIYIARPKADSVKLNLPRLAEKKPLSG